MQLKYSYIEHPVIKHKLSILRDKRTTPMVFRQVIEEMSQLLAYEATRDLKTQKSKVETPFEVAETEIVQESVVLVSIMRAGNEMLSGILKILPFANVGHIGIYRDRFIKSTVEYYLRLPSNLKSRKVLLLDPLLATGDSACAAIDRLKEHDATQIRYLSIISCPEGIQKLNQLHPDVEILTLQLDRTINSDGYLLPGVGDAGDRIYDTH